MEPVVWRRVNELARIISTGPHGCADDVGQVPRLQNPARSIHLDVHRFVEGCRIRLQDNSNLAKVDIVVEKSDSDTAVIPNLIDSAIEVVSIQPGAMNEIGSVIKEGGSVTREASCAHPPQRAVRIDDGWCEIVTTLNHDIVIA